MHNAIRDDLRTLPRSTTAGDLSALLARHGRHTPSRRTPAAGGPPATLARNNHSVADGVYTCLVLTRGVRAAPSRRRACRTHLRRKRHHDENLWHLIFSMPSDASIFNAINNSYHGEL